MENHKPNKSNSAGSDSILYEMLCVTTKARQVKKKKTYKHNEYFSFYAKCHKAICHRHDTLHCDQLLRIDKPYFYNTF